MHRLAIPALLALGLLACPPQKLAPVDAGPVTKLDKADQPDGTGGQGASPEATAIKSRLGKLRGETVVAVVDGPWQKRRIAGTENAKRRRSPRSTALRSIGGAGTGAGGAPTAALEAPPPAEAFAEAEPADAPAGFAGKVATRGRAGFDEGGVAQGRPIPSAPSAAPLKASSTDDNVDFDAFVEFLASWTDRPDTAGKHQFLDVRDRRYLRVLDGKGQPVPAAEVEVRLEPEGPVVFVGTTYGDGQVPFYPRVCEGCRDARTYYVKARSGESSAHGEWHNDDTAKGGSFVISMDQERQLQKVIALDVLFVIDTTGSMGDEIARIKSSLLNVTERLRAMSQEFDLRYGAVLYRDVTDAYLTATHRFTDDIEAFNQALQRVQATGGGDGPESLNQGLAEAVHGVDWRRGAAKVAFVIADAPPHMDYQDDIPYGESLRDAVGLGIRMHCVAASGLDPFGTLVFRQTAQFTRGKFIFIEYGSSAATAAKHGVTGQVQSNNLDAIIYEQLRWELANFGRAP